MTAFLRFFGLANAALWFGASLFCSTVLLAAVNSREFMTVVGTQYFSQMAGAVTLLVFSRLYYMQFFCVLLAGVHLTLEWLYLGRILRRGWVVLLAFLLTLSIYGGFWLCPKLKQLHGAQYLPQSEMIDRDTLEQRFKAWHGVFQALNVTTMLGLGCYLYRLTRAEDETRFVSPFKFRG